MSAPNPEARPLFAAFSPQGILAIDPSAFGHDFAVFNAPEQPFEICGPVAVVRVSGPLCTSSWLFESYAGVKARVAAALASSAEAVVLHIASPGGDVFGCFDTARALRALARTAGKPLIGFTEAQACSSAYALISACDTISASDSSVLGSIGVIATAVDTTKQAEALGVRFAIVTSGARKADGNPMAGITDDVRAAMQTSVDAMASVFFGLVKEHRGIDAAPLEAGSFVGEAAKSAGLVDTIESFDSLLARIGKDGVGAMLPKTTASASKDPKMTDEEKKKDEEAKAAAASKAKADDEKEAPKDDEPKEDATRASLVTASESDDPKKAARAKKALAAYDEGEDEKAEDEKEKEKALAALSGSAPSASTGDARIASLEATAKRAIFASRPDLSADFIKACATLSVEAVETLVAAAPRAKASAAAPIVAGELGRAPVQARTGADADHSPKAVTEELDMLMSMTETVTSHESNGIVQQLGVRRPKAS